MTDEVLMLKAELLLLDGKIKEVTGNDRDRDLRMGAIERRLSEVEQRVQWIDARLDRLVGYISQQRALAERIEALERSR